MFTNYGHRKLLTVLIAALLIFVMALSLTGCEKRGVCESCGQEEVLEEYTCTGRDGPYDEGEVVYLCNYCRQMYKFMGN